MNQEQLAVLPTQLALKLISTGLRGTVPAVLGLTALTVAGTVYGGIKTSQAIKTKVNTPKAGNNKGSKILNDLKNKVNKKTKDGKTVYEPAKIYAFELRNELYQKFEKQAKEMGIAYAATTDEKITHIITDDINKPIIDNLIKNLARNFKEDKNKSKEPNEKTSTAEKEQSSDLYKEVEFKDSLWNKIIDFATNKILNPVQNTGQVDIETNKTKEETGNIIYFDKAKADILSKMSKNLEKTYENIEQDTEKQTELFNEFEDYNKILELQNKHTKQTDEKEPENEIKVDIEDMPEIVDMLQELCKTYSYQSKLDKSEMLKIMHEHLEQHGFKGRLYITTGDKMVVDLDIKDRNNVILFAKNMTSYLREGENIGLKLDELREEAFKTMNKIPSKINISQKVNLDLNQNNKNDTNVNKSKDISSELIPNPLR
ncbi:MAG: hypothetical protein FWF57_00610 [Defluviitaleaceae bacterium]|nr:hypothetical protein [Defluviitaleaceae bacterium]